MRRVQQSGGHWLLLYDRVHDQTEIRIEVSGWMEVRELRWVERYAIKLYKVQT